LSFRYKNYIDSIDVVLFTNILCPAGYASLEREIMFSPCPASVRPSLAEDILFRFAKILHRFRWNSWEVNRYHEQI